MIPFEAKRLKQREGPARLDAGPFGLCSIRGLASPGALKAILMQPMDLACDPVQPCLQRGGLGVRQLSFMAVAELTLLIADAAEVVANPIVFVVVERTIASGLVEAAAQPVLTLLQGPIAMRAADHRRSIHPLGMGRHGRGEGDQAGRRGA